MKDGILNDFLYKYAIPYIGFWVIKIVSATYRFRFLGLENERAALRKYGAVIYGGWHQRLFAGITPFAQRKPIAIIISESRDGEYIARIAQLFGWHAVRGSSSRGGSKAFRAVKALGASRYNIAHIVDGPQGPPEVVKQGLLRIARATGLPILPTGVSPEKRWVFNSWDRFMIPKPFSNILVCFGEAVHIPKGMSKDEIAKQTVKIEKQLKSINRKIDLVWQDGQEIRRLFR